MNHVTLIAAPVLLLAGFASLGCHSIPEPEAHGSTLTTPQATPNDSEFTFPHLHVSVTDIVATDLSSQDTLLGFFDNGQLAYLIPTDSEGELHGLCRAWFPSGQKLLEARYIHGWPDGLITEWDEHGNIVNQQRWFQGVPVN